MDGCSLNLTVSAVACAIAKGKSSNELTLLSVFFTQLGDALATIDAGNTICCNNKNENDGNVNSINIT